MKKLQIRSFGIGTLKKCPPLISFDSKYLFTIGDEGVQVWIVETGQILRILKQKKSSDQQENCSNIVSIDFNPTNRLQLCVAHQSGLIQIWDYEDGILIHTIEIHLELVEIYSIANVHLLLLTKTESNVYSLHRIDSLRHYSTTKQIIDKFPTRPKSLSFNRNGREGLFINDDGTQIYLIELETKQLKLHLLTKQNLSFHQKIVCCSIHPHEETFALGTQSGRIGIFFDFHRLNLDKQLKCSYLHWHSLPVVCLQFSFDGSHLYSGGYECVLVKWNYRTNEPTFRPRLGSPLLYIRSSPDQTFCLTTHEDNNIQIISSHLTIKQTISGLNQRFLNEENSSPAGLHMFMRERSIIMNCGKPGHLQMISIDDGKLISNLDIVGENYISPSEISSECFYNDVKRLTIHSSENWLVTFEEKYSNRNPFIDDEEQTERKIRFWKWNSNSNQFELNTTIEYPHGDKTLNEMLFHPTKLELVTTGNDGLMKLWSFVDENPLTKRQCHWKCFNGQSYRSYSCRSLCFYLNEKSFEWNLISSFEHLVTVWIEQKSLDCSYEYSHCFAHFDRTNQVQSIYHSNETLFVVHQRLVNLWNSTTRTFLKTYPWIIHSIAKDPRSSYIACFERNFLHFYSFDDGKCLTRKNSLFRQVESSLFIPNHQSSTFSPFKHSKLIFSIRKQGLKVLFDDENDFEPIIDDDHQDQLAENRFNDDEKGNLLKELLLRQSTDSPKDFSLKRKRFSSEYFFDSNQRKSSSEFSQQLITTPSYLLPSIEHYSMNSLKEMLQSNRFDDDQHLVPQRNSIEDSKEFDD